MLRILSLCTNNVSTANMNGGKMEYAKFGRVRLSNHVIPCYGHILQRAHQQTCFQMKKYLGVTLAGTDFPHVQEWAILPQSNMCYSIGSMGMDVRRATSTWKIMMKPHDIKMEDISNLIFDTVFGSPI